MVGHHKATIVQVVSPLLRASTRMMLCGGEVAHLAIIANAPMLGLTILLDVSFDDAEIAITPYPIIAYPMLESDN